MKIDNQVIRNDCLEELYSNVESILADNKIGLIHLTGQSGTGKSTILNQFESYLQFQGLFPQLMKFAGHEKFSLRESILAFAENSGLTPLIQNLPISNGPRFIYQVLTRLHHPKNRFSLILIDDAHLLPSDETAIIQKLSDSGFKDPIVFIFCGIDLELNASSIHITEFTDNEFLDYFNLTFYEGWCCRNTEVKNWIERITRKNPFYTDLLVKHCIQTGLLDNSFTASMELFNECKFPETLAMAVHTNFDWNGLGGLEKRILKYLTVSLDGFSKKQLLVTTNSKNNDSEINSLIENGWIRIENQKFYIYHSLLVDHIQKKISSNEEMGLHRKIINSIDDLTESEKSHHLYRSGELTPKDKKFLISHCDVLQESGYPYQALQIYNRIDPDNKDAVILYKKAEACHGLSQYDDVIKYTDLFFNSPDPNLKNKFSKRMGYIHFARGDFKESEKWYRRCLDSETITDEEMVHAKRGLVSPLIYMGQVDEVYEIVAYLKTRAPENEDYDLAYHSIVGMLSTNLDMGIDHVSFYQKGIQLAKEMDDIDQALFFQICLMTWYVNRNDFEHILDLGNELLKLSREYFKPAVEMQALYLLNSGYLWAGDYIRAIDSAEQCIHIMQSLKMDYNYASILSGTGTAYANIGFAPKEDEYYKKLIKHAETAQNLFMHTRLKISQYHLRWGRTKTAVKQLKHIKADAKEQGYERDRILAELTLDISNYNKSNQKTNDRISDNIQKLKAMNELNYLPRIYYEWSKKLAQKNDWDGLNALVENWKCETTTEDYDLKHIAEIYNSIGQGRVNQCLALLKKFEDNFNGCNLREYKDLYEWLSEQNAFPEKPKQRAKDLASAFHSIRMNEPNQDFKITLNHTPFNNLIKGWKNSIDTDRTLDNELLEQYDDGLVDILKLWGIEAVDPEINIPINNKPVIINLLGPPELYVDNRKLTIEDYFSRKVLELLSYLIIKGWTLKTDVDKSQLLSDVWETAPEKSETANRYKNVTFHRLRKTFENLPEPMVFLDDLKAGFNWDADCYRLDLDLFWTETEKGINEFNIGELEKAQSLLEAGIGHYRGYLAEKCDGLWIESMRGTFHNQFLKSVQTLLNIYCQLELNQERTELTNSLLSRFPEMKPEHS